MGTKLNKRAYMQLIEEDLAYLNLHCEEGSLEKDHIRCVLCSSIDWYYPKQLKESKVERECPYCKSKNVIMFDSDNDICEECRRWFPGT
jgi:exoribonuclease II